MSVIGAVDNQGSVKSPVSAPQPDKPKKYTKKEKSPPTKASKSQSQASTDVKIAELDSKWSEHFNCLEALIMAKSFELTFSANVKVTPTQLHQLLRMYLNRSSDLLLHQRFLDLASLLKSIR